MARRQLNKREKKLKEQEDIEIPDIEEDVPASKGFMFANLNAGTQDSDGSEEEKVEVKPVQKQKKKKKKKNKQQE